MTLVLRVEEGTEWPIVSIMAGDTKAVVGCLQSLDTFLTIEVVEGKVEFVSDENYASPYDTTFKDVVTIGSSIGSKKSKLSSGTIGGCLKEKGNEQIYGLTCAHVVMTHLKDGEEVEDMDNIVWRSYSEVVTQQSKQDDQYSKHSLTKTLEKYKEISHKAEEEGHVGRPNTSRCFLNGQTGGEY